MGEYEISRAEESNLKGAITEYSVPPQSTDGPTDQKESIHEFPKFTQYFAYYNDIPELRAVVDAIARWTVGKGFKADAITSLTLDTIEATGKDTFNTIIENLVRTYQITEYRRFYE